MPTFTRETMEELLRESGFRQGVAHDDPEKDATHVWVDPQGDRFVRFAPKGQDDRGEVIYGDVQQEEPGIGLSYKKAVAVMKGLLSAKEAHERPEGIFDPMLGHALGTSPALGSEESREKKLLQGTTEDDGERTDTIPSDKPTED